jgi:RecA-family ATPase
MVRNKKEIMENALSYITVLPSAKAEVSNFASQIISSVEAGEINPLSLKIRLKWFEKLIEAIDKPIRDAVMNEAMKFEKSFEKDGFKIEQAEVGTKYDYSNCNDPTLNDLNERLDKLTQQKKDRETFLKSINGHVEVPDEMTGEMVVVYPPVKSSTSGLKFTAK